MKTQAIAFYLMGGTIWVAALVIALKACSFSSPVDSARLRNLRALYLALAFFGLIFWRAPVIGFNDELNLDESEKLAQAHKYLVDWMPWRSVDGTTSGPLNSYVLLWAPLFGLPLTYWVARVTGVLLVFITVSCSESFLRHAVCPRYSLLGVHPLLTFYMLAWGQDFLHFSSESLPLALLAGAAALIAETHSKATRPVKVSKNQFFAGLLLGAAPMAKLQAGPVAMVLGGIAVVGLLTRTQRSTKRRGWPLAALIGGALVVPAVFLIPIASAGVWDEFWLRYIRANLFYGNPVRLSTLTVLTGFLQGGQEAAALIGGSLFFGSCAFYYMLRNQQRADRFPVYVLVSTIVCSFATLVSIVRSGFVFPHYLLFLIMPVSLFAGCALGYLLREATPQENGTRSASEVRTAFALCFLASTVFFQWWNYPSLSGLQHIGFLRNFRQAAVLNPIETYIAKNSSPNDRLAVWGWAPRYYITTGLVPATRDIVGYFVLFEWEHAKHYRRVYLEDVQNAAPRFFVDSVTEQFLPAGWPPSADKARVDLIPELAQYIRSNYRLVQELPVEGATQRIRLYERYDAYSK